MATLSNQAIKGIKKIGDIYLPGDSEFPPYSEVAGTFKLNDMVQYAPDDDIKSLSTVLTIFSFLPMFVLRWIVKLMTNANERANDGLIPSMLRMLDLGLRGLLYSTYYSEFTNPDYKGKTPMQLIDFEPHRIPN